MFEKYLVANQKGQALLIVVLVMVISLTVGLSIVSRTLTNIRTSTEQAQSQKALSAAEAGIQQSLKNGANVADQFEGAERTTYSSTLTQVSGTTPFLVSGGNIVSKDDGVYIWVTPYTSNYSNLWCGNSSCTPWTGTLSLYWGSPADVCDSSPSKNTAAAMEVAMITGTRVSPSVLRAAYDPCSRGNNFTSVSKSSYTIAGKTFAYRAQINISDGLLVRIVPLYASTFAAASGSVNLPQQGTTVVSVGTSDTTQRKIQVFQSFPELPSELFPYSFFSP